MAADDLPGMPCRNGGFLYALVQGFSLERAGKIGAYAGAHTVQRVEPVVSPKLTPPEEVR